MKDKIKEFRDGIFTLRTRRFGTVAELMIRALYHLDKSQNQHHDLYDKTTNQRIEVKFSTVMKTNKEKITRHNVIDQCRNATIAKRALNIDGIHETPFDSNIQQVKCKEFDVLYYGLFFADCIVIFKITSEEILTIPGYSDKQHKGNKGEGQFHLSDRTLAYHMEKYYEQQLTYEDLYDLLSPEK